MKRAAANDSFLGKWKFPLQDFSLSLKNQPLRFWSKQREKRRKMARRHSPNVKNGEKMMILMNGDVKTKKFGGHTWNQLEKSV